ncbi:adenine-specific DNA-methyltransferase [Arthrobacter sp. CAN_A6]|uniref:DNA methyltransferase n=1 Tax=Arthrobacter sp. CAN_A6 TaxID=2787721 RepID=UPI0018CBB03D
MSRLTDLLRAAKQLDPQLGKDLEDEIQPLQQRLPFGLNFERHAPEAVELAGHKVRRGSKVRVLPLRGSATSGDKRLWRVDAIRGDTVDISLLDTAEIETRTVQGDDLILVAEFRDWIYPGLRPDGTVERGGSKSFHTVINGENFHVLEQLTFTHAKSIDAIYIDPPYNTGARDWKYNNDYVEGDDLYRHSKWLAFMERRLELAKLLLNPNDSILIVTIDEKEYLRLGLLLEQVFPDASIQMISDVINPSGSSRQQMFSRSDEYAYFVFLGNSSIAESSDDMLNTSRELGSREVRWDSLMRRGDNGRRSRRPNLYYPLYFSIDDGSFSGYGPALAENEVGAPPREGQLAVLPVRDDGAEMTWGTSGEIFTNRLRAGYVRHYFNSSSRMVIRVLQSGTIQEIESGLIDRVGMDALGFDKFVYKHAKQVRPMTTWHRGSHSASDYGTPILSALIPRRRFPFPKSLYGVEDVLRFAVGNKPDAVVLDFFAGSGTTAHAVMRLNKQDGGSRQVVLVTNNEVSSDEQRKLRAKNLRPGDPEWEQHGICEAITKPRIRAAITGRTPEDEPIKGDYKFVDEFPMSDGFVENAAFFTLTYESPWRVSTDRAFAAIAPMLWLRAGAKGQQIDNLLEGWAVAEAYGIIKNLDLAADFIAAVQAQSDIRIAYIVTDDEGRYQQIANEIPGIETVRLYEEYLLNCESNGNF